jgi:hypothetical protein
VAADSGKAVHNIAVRRELEHAATAPEHLPTDLLVGNQKEQVAGEEVRSTAHFRKAHHHTEACSKELAVLELVVQKT